jgi:hypothetical protein
VGIKTKGKDKMKLQERLGGFQRQKYRQIKFGDQNLEVYLPTRNEMKGLMDKLKKPPQELIDGEYKTLLDSLWQFCSPTDDGIEVLENDVKVQGVSMKSTARFTAIKKMREIAMISLVGFKEGDDLFALSYEDIADTLSEVEITELVKSIESAVNPDYETTKKN